MLLHAPWYESRTSAAEIGTGMLAMPSASNGSGAGPAVPAHPIHAPRASVTIGSRAETSPPGLLTHVALPLVRSRRTGNVFATITNGHFAERILFGTTPHPLSEGKTRISL